MMSKATRPVGTLTDSYESRVRTILELKLSFGTTVFRSDTHWMISRYLQALTTRYDTKYVLVTAGDTRPGQSGIGRWFPHSLKLVHKRVLLRRSSRTSREGIRYEMPKLQPPTFRELLNGLESLLPLVPGALVLRNGETVTTYTEVRTSEGSVPSSLSLSYSLMGVLPVRLMPSLVQSEPNVARGPLSPSPAKPSSP